MALAGGGYDYDFVHNSPDRLICAICHLPCRDPQLSTCCGNNFCKADIESFRKSSTAVTKSCPVCRRKFEFCINHQAMREINELRVYCPNKNAGCDWIGEVKKVKTHRENNNGCLFEMLECPHGCGLEHQRQNLASHIDAQCPCYCQYCCTTADKTVISDQHKEKCKKFPTACPNKCGEMGIPYEKVEEHRKKCPLELVDCLFSDVGCAVTVSRKDREVHNSNNIEKHLKLAKIHISKMKADFAEAIAASEQKYERLNRTVDETMKILHTKVTMDGVKAEQVKSNNTLRLTINQRTVEAKQDAKANLTREVNKIIGSVQNVQTKVDNCQKRNEQNENNLTVMRNRFNRELDTVRRTVQDEIKQRERIFTIKNFALLLIIVFISAKILT